MTKQQAEEYEDVEELRRLVKMLAGRKFRLDCGHHVTFGHYFGNNVVIQNGKHPRLLCSDCA